jgi:hypothetical protein
MVGSGKGRDRGDCRTELALRRARQPARPIGTFSGGRTEPLKGNAMSAITKKPLILAMTLLAAAFTSGCEDPRDVEWNARMDRLRAEQAEYHQAVRNYIRTHGELPPGYGPPPTMGVTDCTSSLSFGDVITSCDSY